MPSSAPSLSDRAKSVLPFVGVGAVIVLAVIVVWKSASPPPTEEQEGFHLACKACGHAFVVPREDIRTYPGDPDTGFKCEKCGRPAADVAAKCRACGAYYAPRADAPGCPRCLESKVAAGAASKG
jgi:hypothetical protein